MSAEVDTQCPSTEYYFEYGTAKGVFDQRIVSVFSSSCNPVTLEFILSGLAEGTTYYGRLVAINGVKITYGTSLVFTTDAFLWLLFWPIFAEVVNNVHEIIFQPLFLTKIVARSWKVLWIQVAKTPRREQKNTRKHTVSMLRMFIKRHAVDSVLNCFEADCSKSTLSVSNGG